MMTKSLLLSFFLIIHCTSTGFVYQGVSTLPFAPTKLESINENLLLASPYVIRQMRLGQTYYDQQFAYTPPYHLTNSYIAYQQQEQSALIIKQISISPSMTYINERREYVMQQGLLVDGAEVFVPMSGTKMAIGVLDQQGKFSIQQIEGGGYFEFGNIAKISDKQLAIGCKENLYIIDRTTFKVTQKIQILPIQKMQDYYQVEFTLQDNNEIIAIRNKNNYWLYQRSPLFEQFQLQRQIHYNAWKDVVFPFSQHVTYILTPSCEVQQIDLTKGDNFLGFSSDSYFIDKTIAFSVDCTYFLSNSGYLQLLDVANRQISIDSRLLGLQDDQTITQAQFSDDGKNIFVLSQRFISKYTISSKQFGQNFIGMFDAFTCSKDYSLVFTTRKANDNIIMGAFQSKNFNQLASLQIQSNGLPIVQVMMYKVYDAIDSIEPLIIVLKTSDNVLTSYHMGYFRTNQTFQFYGVSQLSQQYQILSAANQTLIINFNQQTTELKLLNWKGEYISSKSLSRSPSFMKAGQTQLMVTYSDGISEFYAVQNNFTYLGSHYRYKDGAEYSTLFLQKLQIVYTYNAGAVFYSCVSNELPISLRVQLQKNLCSDATTKAIIYKTAYGADKDFFVAFLNYNLSQISYCQVVPNPKDGLSFVMTKTAMIPKNVSVDAQSQIAYNRAKDWLYLTAKIKNKSKTIIMAAVFKNIASDYKWRWSYSLSRIDDFDFDESGALAVLGETVYGNIYKFGFCEKTFKDIKSEDVLATNREGDIILIKKQAIAIENLKIAHVNLSVFNVKQSIQLYAFQLLQTVSIYSINSAGQLIFVANNDSSFVNLYLKGSYKASTSFQSKVTSIHFHSAYSLIVQTDSQIHFLNVQPNKFEMTIKFSQSKNAALLYTSNNSNLFIKQNQKIVILDQNGQEIQRLSLSQSKDSSIQSLLVINQHIIASKNNLIYTWKQQDCSLGQQNNQGICQCVSNSIEKQGLCDCERGYYFKDEKCQRCGMYCDTCNQNGCDSWNIAFFASLIMAVLIVLATIWYLIQKLKRSSPKVMNESLVSETNKSTITDL